MPDVYGRSLPIQVPSLDFIDAGRFRWQPHRQESVGKGVVDEGHQAGPAAIVPAQRVAGAAGGLLDFRRHARDQLRVGAAKAIDRLLGVADPGAR